MQACWLFLFFLVVAAFLSSCRFKNTTCFQYRTMQTGFPGFQNIFCLASVCCPAFNYWGGLGFFERCFPSRGDSGLTGIAKKLDSDPLFRAFESIFFESVFFNSLIQRTMASPVYTCVILMTVWTLNDFGCTDKLNLMHKQFE